MNMRMASVRTLALLGFMNAAALAQTPTVVSVVDAADYGATLCPGLTAFVYGSNFGTNAAAVTVKVGTQAGYVFTSAGAVEPTEILVQIPFGLATGPTTLTVTVAGAASAPFPITLSATAPAIPTQNALGTGLASVYHQSSALVTYASPAVPNETLTMYAYGLGQTNPALVTGQAAAAPNPAVTAPTLTIGTTNVPILFAGAVPGYIGFYQINFAAPSTGVQGTEPIVISTGGQSSPSGITIALAGLSSVVVNGSFANPGVIAPGSIASVFANGLGSASTNQLSLFPATSSESVGITFNGTPAPLFHLLPTASPQQIDFLVPANLPTTGTVNVQLTTSSTNYPSYTLTMAPASPSMFRFTDPKTSNAYAIVQFANSAWVVLPTAATTDIGFPVCAAGVSALIECGEPANIGDVLVIYLTGLGLATVNGSPTGATLPSGQNPPVSGSPLYETPTLPTVTIGGVPATVAFSGLTPGYAGEYQIDVTVPAGVASGDSVPLKITMLGMSDTANISIQPSRVKPPNQ